MCLDCDLVGPQSRRHQLCDFGEHATSAFAELAGETHDVSRNRARTQVLLRARKWHVSGSGTFGAFWLLVPSTALGERCTSDTVGRLSYCLFVGFLFVRARSIRISPDVHKNFTAISQGFTIIATDFARISNWSTLKKGITSTQPSHKRRPRATAARVDAALPADNVSQYNYVHNNIIT